MNQFTPAPDPNIDDLMPGLMDHPLWKGTDEEFAAYVRETFSLPNTITAITIAPRGSAGRAAVAIASRESGGIIFVIAQAGPQQTQISPFVVGPLSESREVVDRARRSDGIENMRALSGLLTRHLELAVALDLLAPVHH